GGGEAERGWEIRWGRGSDWPTRVNGLRRISATACSSPLVLEVWNSVSNPSSKDRSRKASMTSWPRILAISATLFFSRCLFAGVAALMRYTRSQRREKREDFFSSTAS